jgi:miniconductance mechanosensitive channel
MTIESIQTWLLANPYYGLAAVALGSALLYLLFRWLIGRVLYNLAERTATVYDDLIIKSLHPFRVAWLAPLIVIYFFSDFALDTIPYIRDVSLIGICLVSAYALVAILNGINAVYEARPSYNGVSIQGYLDIVKIFIWVVGLVLSISIITGDSPIILLSGLGAATAVLLLVFRDTILSIVASFQITALDLIKEGDWIEVPGYGADGDVVDMSLHAIKIRNFDKTTTVIPTYKMVDTAYKNYRSMQQGGGRRIKRALLIDMNTIQFCTPKNLAKLAEVEIIASYVKERLAEIDRGAQTLGPEYDWPLDGPQITNLEIFHEYIAAYLRSRGDIHTEGFPFLIRDLEPTTNGLPIELYAFTKVVEWDQYELIQASIFNHLIAALPFFDLMPYQQPSGRDFSVVVGN